MLGVGDRDQAFVWFEKAYSDHSKVLTGLKVNPAFDALRTDPRFPSLMRRVRLAP
jgi:adenylate cyclase